MSRFASLLIILVLAGSAGAQGKEEPLVKKVKTSIHNGVKFLVKIQNKDGSWEATKSGASIYQGGSTALALLALMQCENIPDDPQLEQERKKAIEQGLKSLRLIESDRVYVRAMQVMALVEASHLKSEAANRKADRAIIERNVQWILDARVRVAKSFIGWTYNKRSENSSTDASNSQYALLALWYARQAGVTIERAVWEEIHAHYVQTQAPSGSWLYSQNPDYNRDEKGPSLTMTVAGLCGLQIATMELNGGREQWQPGGAFKNCGNYNDEQNSLPRALQWLGKNYNVKPDFRTYYHLYGLERAGRLTGQRFFGEHDWYREGCEYLVKKQETNGSWPNPGGWDKWPHVNTSFALLFLSKGRTPVLISKLVHGEWTNGRNERDLDWNNDRNDLRHLTDYVAKTTDMFGKKPLAWQTYDIARAQEAYRTTYKATGAEVDAAVVADMKQSPILYITGHESITQRFTDGEVTLIKRYVENGGFIVAEACCGSADFDKSFKQWVKDNWGQELEYLPSTHSVWTCENTIMPGEPYKLMGLNVGCRTMMLYSPQDMSCFWESNKLDDAKSQVAFRLGVNIVAYGTGRTPPLPRLTPVAVAYADDKRKEPRGQGVFRVMQIRHSADSQPAPKAMTNLLAHVHKVIGIDTGLEAKTLRLDTVDPKFVRREKFFYMHGKNAFSINKDDLAPLDFTLRNGGLLFADACCGNDAFDKSFRKFVSDLFPREKLVRVPFEEKDRDPLFGANNNGGEPLTAANIQCRTAPNGKMQPMEPMLEGIKIDGRWVVLYSRFDIGCALERHTSPDCVGYAPESALRIATAVVRYNVRP